MASAQVFDTTELLEMILYKLPVKDLLFAQRVAKQWKAAIDNSVKLQQALFFRPVPVGPSPFVKVPNFATIDEHKKFRKQMRGQRGNCMLNPLLKDVCINIRRCHEERGLLKESIIERLPVESFWYEKASWKRMLFIQPLLKDSFRVKIFYRDEGKHCVQRINPGSDYFSMDIIESFDKQMDECNGVCGGTFSLYDRVQVDFGTYLECCDELEDLIKHARREKEREPDDGRTET